MKKLFIIGLLVSMSIVGFIYAHPGDDLDSASGCHTCKTNCSDYGLSYGEFHCHKTSLEYEIQAIQSYYSSRGFGRSSALDAAIQQARLRWINNQNTSSSSSSSSNYTSPTYIDPAYTKRQEEIENLGKLIEYLRIASDFYNKQDYENVISTLSGALPYARAISIEEETKFLGYIADARKKLETKNLLERSDAFIKATQDCQNVFGDKAYGIMSGGILICNCYAGYEFSNTTPESCIDSTVTINNNAILNAISWMYINGLTTYNTINKFKPDDYVTREQASKFFVEFLEKIVGSKIDTTKKVSLSDLSKADKTLQGHIKKANQGGLFKGIKGKFFPFNKLTRAQAIAVLMRITNGIQAENDNKWYNNYYVLANSYKILDGLGFDYSTLDSVNITRGEVALLLYRLVDNGIVQQN